MTAETQAEAKSDANAKRALTITRIIDAPRELVFKTWTTPELLTQWWGPHGMTTPVVEMDPRSGGIFRSVMRDADGKEYPGQGIFLEVVEPERIVFTDAFTAAWVPSDKPFMTAIITLEDVEGRTRYTARAMHWSQADLEAHEAMGFHKGWGESLDRFEALVAKQKAAS